MKLFHLFSVAALVLPMIVSATDNTSLNATSPSIEVSPASQYWKFIRYGVTEQDGKTVVTARLQPKPPSVTNGNIQAQAFDKDGKLLAISECRMTPRPLSKRERKSPTGNYTQVVFSSLLPADAHIKVSVLGHKANCQPATP
ncbi:MAG: hypothetical protein IPK95_12850 [Cellvibrionales bacterium]|nr:hypothetical protein [Cellvibrionales bacterium]